MVEALGREALDLGGRRARVRVDVRLGGATPLPARVRGRLLAWDAARRADARCPPSLLLGKDVPIYGSTNAGRSYKVGYIVGVNLCGLVFFGLAFRQPRPR